jgi:hypothetical protein
LDLLSKKIKSDADKDQSRNRLKLAEKLNNCALTLAESKKEIDLAWEICRKFV